MLKKFIFPILLLSFSFYQETAFAQNRPNNAPNDSLFSSLFKVIMLDKKIDQKNVDLIGAVNLDQERYSLQIQVYSKQKCEEGKPCNNELTPLIIREIPLVEPSVDNCNVASYPAVYNRMKDKGFHFTAILTDFTNTKCKHRGVDLKYPVKLRLEEKYNNPNSSLPAIFVHYFEGKSFKPIKRP